MTSPRTSLDPSNKANLVIQTAFLGDLLLSVPLLKNIRQKFPNEKIVLVCRQGIGSIFKQVGLADEVLEVIKGYSDSYTQLKNELKKFEFDKIFCPHESLRSALLVSGLKAQEKIGYKTWWNGLFFNIRVPKMLDLPDALRQLYLLTSFDSELSAKFQNLDAKSMIAKNQLGKLSNVPIWADSSLKDLFLTTRPLKEYGFSLTAKPIVLVFPGSVWATKKWTTEGFVGASQRLEENGYQIIWMGSSSEKELCEELNKNLRSGIVLASSTSIFETCWLMARSALVIGNDSSSSHMASLTETPTVAIFGPTVLSFGYRPWHNKAYIAEIALPCRPCGPHGHMKCPIGTHDCMKLIKTESVVEKALAILQLQNNPSR